MASLTVHAEFILSSSVLSTSYCHGWSERIFLNHERIFFPGRETVHAIVFMKWRCSRGCVTRPRTCGRHPAREPYVMTLDSTCWCVNLLAEVGLPMLMLIFTCRCGNPRADVGLHVLLMDSNFSNCPWASCEGKLLEIMPRWGCYITTHMHMLYHYSCDGVVRHLKMGRREMRYAL